MWLYTLVVKLNFLLKGERFLLHFSEYYSTLRGEKGSNFCRKRFSFHWVIAITKLKMSPYNLSEHCFFLTLYKIFLLTKFMKQTSFSCENISPSLLFHIQSNLFKWNFFKRKASVFNVALHKNEKCLTIYYL